MGLGERQAGDSFQGPYVRVFLQNGLVNDVLNTAFNPSSFCPPWRSISPDLGVRLFQYLLDFFFISENGANRTGKTTRSFTSMAFSWATVFVGERIDLWGIAHHRGVVEGDRIETASSSDPQGKVCRWFAGMMQYMYRLFAVRIYFSHSG